MIAGKILKTELSILLPMQIEWKTAGHFAIEMSNSREVDISFATAFLHKFYI